VQPELTEGGERHRVDTADIENVLADACAGWRHRQRCTDENGAQLADPHPTCLDAQHRLQLLRLGHPRPTKP
jgi:hypothetical protein